LQTFIFGPLTYDDLFFRNLKTVFLFRLWPLDNIIGPII
jgi:hypothetical protein